MEDGSAHCYECDDFVDHDNKRGSLGIIREQLRAAKGDAAPAVTRSGRRRVAQESESDSASDESSADDA